MTPVYRAIHDKTYFALSPDGFFYEIQAGRGSFDLIVDDIVHGQRDVARVFVAWGPDWQDASNLVADAVYSKLLKMNDGFIPNFLKTICPLSAEDLAWRNGAEDRRAAEAVGDNYADRLYDAMREAAE